MQIATNSEHGNKVIWYKNK